MPVKRRARHVGRMGQEAAPFHHIAGERLKRGKGELFPIRSRLHRGRDVAGFDGLARQALNDQFQQLTKQLDAFISNATFGGKKLLDGNFSLSLGDLLGGGDSDNISFGNFGSANLFGGNPSLSADGIFSAIGVSPTV